MKFSIKGLISGAALALAAMSVQAVPITSAGSLTIGDKTFSNFTCSITSGGLALTGPNACSQINVEVIGDGSAGSPYGLAFNSGFSAFGLGWEDILLGYRVTVTDPSQAIDEIGLAFNGSFVGLAVTQVVETVFNNGNLVGQAEVHNGSGIGAQLQDLISLNGAYTVLDVVKDIYLGAAGGLASISYIQQTFPQTDVPLPAPLALLGLGLFSLGLTSRRKQ